MSINAKTLVKDRFWIIEEDGAKIGTLQKEENNGWIFLSKKDQREKFPDIESVKIKFGPDIFDNDPVQEKPTQVDNEQPTEVHGYPVNQIAYNAMFDVTKQLPIYTKTPKSKSLFCAGYYIIEFPKGWRKAFCPKLITLQRYTFKGPIKTKLEMQQILNESIKDSAQI
jgi:hypothetical protein